MHGPGVPDAGAGSLLWRCAAAALAAQHPPESIRPHRRPIGHFQPLQSLRRQLHAGEQHAATLKPKIIENMPMQGKRAAHSNFHLKMKRIP